MWHGLGQLCQTSLGAPRRYQKEKWKMKTAQWTLSLERCPYSGLYTHFVNLCLEFCMCLYNNKYKWQDYGSRTQAYYNPNFCPQDVLCERHKQKVILYEFHKTTTIILKHLNLLDRWGWRRGWVLATPPLPQITKREKRMCSIGLNLPELVISKYILDFK